VAIHSNKNVTVSVAVTNKTNAYSVIGSGPFHLISTPSLWKRSIKICPLRNERSKVPTCVPPQKLPKFSFALRKKPIFSQTPWKYLKDQMRRRSNSLRNDNQGLLRKSLPSAGADPGVVDWVASHSSLWGHLSFKLRK